MRVILLFCLACNCIWSSAQAEILTIDVTIKTVDTLERTVSVTRISKTKSKDLELEVAKKAQILVDGKQASLSSVKPGQSASVSYETSLELITKIDVSKSDTPAEMGETEEAAFKTTGCRVIWAITEDGEATVTIGRPLESRKPASDELIRHEDGTFELQYDFETSESVQKASRITTNKADNVGFSPTQKALVLTHRKGRPHGSANFIFSKFIQFPITIEYEFEGVKKGNGFLVGANLRSRENTKFPVLNVQSNNGFQSVATVNPLWIESRDSMGRAKVKNLFDQHTKAIQLNRTNEVQYSVPVPSIDQKYLLELGVIGEDIPVAIQYLSVRGRLFPTWGVVLEESNGKVVAKKVLPGSLSESTGMTSGDVIEKINGAKPTTLAGFLKLLEEVQIGDEGELVVKRGATTVKINFTAE